MGEQKEKKWYAIKVHSGFEKPVLASINQAKESLGLSDRIFEVILPIEKQVRLKDGKRIEKEGRIYPGSILVNMILDDQTWYAISNIEHVSGFFGSRSHAESIPDFEIDKIKMNMNKISAHQGVKIRKGTHVKIISGPFEGKDGVIKEFDAEKDQVKVLINFLGTSNIKLDLCQIREI